MTPTHASEIASGSRFEFGANWQRFLKTVDDERIDEAQRSLAEMLGRSNLSGARFLDIGCGSGLFSLAARRMGAVVHSFDFDPTSVACAKEMRRRYASDDNGWTIEEGSVLDTDYVRSLGTFDIVYSWGVLHHTGALWSALDSARIPVDACGQLFIAIYNDQGWRSRAWWRVKALYCSGSVGRTIALAIFVPLFTAQAALVGLLRRRSPLWQFRNFKSKRGMSIYHDWVDWLGGLPFEYATVDVVRGHYEAQGYVLECLTPTKRWGCNQFVFRRAADVG